MSEDVPEYLKDHPEGAEIKTYKGGCHCRRFAFDYDYPSFEMRPPTTCNCSFCIIQGVFVAYGKDAKNPLRWTKGSPHETGKYLWESKQLTWHFCPSCGVTLLWHTPGTMGVNARCLDEFAQLAEVDFDKIKLIEFDGASLLPDVPASRQEKADKAVESTYSICMPPSAQTKDKDMILKHKGGCHCRKFEFEFDYPYLDVNPPMRDNCSICFMQAAILVYNDEDKLRWTKGSLAETSKYQWNDKVITWHFCPDCSSLLLWSGRGGRVGVNTRCFDDFAQVDLEKLELVKGDGANIMPGTSPAKQEQLE